MAVLIGTACITQERIAGLDPRGLQRKGRNCNGHPQGTTQSATTQSADTERARELTFPRFSNNLRLMRIRTPVIILAAAPALAELQTGPAVPYHVLRDWGQLPAGWSFGEVSSV